MSKILRQPKKGKSFFLATISVMYYIQRHLTSESDVLQPCVLFLLKKYYPPKRTDTVEKTQVSEAQHFERSCCLARHIFSPTCCYSVASDMKVGRKFVLNCRESVQESERWRSKLELRPFIFINSLCKQASACSDFTATLVKD